MVDEFTSNALYNAPLDASGCRRFAHLPRTQEVVLDEDEAVEVSFVSDGSRIGISVADPFGSLQVETVQAYLSRCLRRGDDQINNKDGGAGLGLYCSLESLSHLIINIKKNYRTELIGLLDVSGTHRDFASRGKSFSIFMDG